MHYCITMTSECHCILYELFTSMLSQTLAACCLWMHLATGWTCTIYRLLLYLECVSLCEYVGKFPHCPTLTHNLQHAIVSFVVATEWCHPGLFTICNCPQFQFMMSAVGGQESQGWHFQVSLHSHCEQLCRRPRGNTLMSAVEDTHKDNYIAHVAGLWMHHHGWTHYPHHKLHHHHYPHYKLLSVQASHSLCVCM